jgi:hypothetical protein
MPYLLQAQGETPYHHQGKSGLYAGVFLALIAALLFNLTKRMVPAPMCKKRPQSIEQSNEHRANDVRELRLHPISGRCYVGQDRIRRRGWHMQKEVLLEILKQNEFTSHFSLDPVSEENESLKLNDKTASIGFIYRHIGETMNLFAAMLGVPTDVKNTTIGQTDEGQGVDVEYSRTLISRGYCALRELVESGADEDWLKPVDTPFFGTVTRVRLFVHVLFHTSNHAGQMSLTLARGSKYR